jgi:hypothetical protein
MSILFTQYFLPDGHTKPNSIDMPEDVEEKARKLIEKGCHFDVETLTTGMISMTCEKDDEVLSISICENGPPVLNSVRYIIDVATERLSNPELM